ncbi:ATP-binding protein [Sinosporangium siamense]|uniref:Histidine kinase/HSP90-like ATPase domain-containing protein n=1 Tax=Sinosporangium siamense TaxID=1367973 RepID=A0A919V918_9ACTN|nr:ATP-binding protein [Sinosporangium siamense]GII96720.1 hypothetical protein Ssi02_69510 [Sinosporangium siamense]
MPPTTAELIRDYDLGDLVDHTDVALSGGAAFQLLARQRVSMALTHRASAEQIGDAVLLTNELVGNAIKHSRGVVWMILEVYEKGVVVSALDRKADVSSIPTASAVNQKGEAGSESGRGLYLVAQFSTAWAAQAIEREKTFDLTGGALRRRYGPRSHAQGAEACLGPAGTPS